MLVKLQTDEAQQHLVGYSGLVRGRYGLRYVPPEIPVTKAEVNTRDLIQGPGQRHV